MAVGLLRADTADRLMAAEKQALLIPRPNAGHRVPLPGENMPRSAINAHGSADADHRGLVMLPGVRSRHCFVTAYSDDLEDE